jgi:hypothetical protein
MTSPKSNLPVTIRRGRVGRPRTADKPGGGIRTPYGRILCSGICILHTLRATWAKGRWAGHLSLETPPRPNNLAVCVSGYAEGLARRSPSFEPPPLGAVDVEQSAELAAAVQRASRGVFTLEWVVGGEGLEPPTSSV